MRAGPTRLGTPDSCPCAPVPLGLPTGLVEYDWDTHIPHRQGTHGPQVTVYERCLAKHGHRCQQGQGGGKDEPAWARERLGRRCPGLAVLWPS